MEATEGTEGTEGTAGGGGRSDCGRLSAWGQIRHAAEKQKERLGGCLGLSINRPLLTELQDRASRRRLRFLEGTLARAHGFDPRKAPKGRRRREAGCLQAGYGTTGLRDYGMEATEGREGTRGTKGTEGTTGGGGRSDCGRLSAWGQIRHAAEKQKERLGGCLGLSINRPLLRGFEPPERWPQPCDRWRFTLVSVKNPLRRCG